MKSNTTAFSRAVDWLCCGIRNQDDGESNTYTGTSAHLSSSVTQGGQQHRRKISPVGKLQAIEHIVSPKYESLTSDSVTDHLASFDSFSDLDPESQKQSSIEEYRNQVLLPELLVTGACPVITEYQRQQQYENCSNSSTSTLHAFHLLVHQQQATAVKDVACQCDGDNGGNSGSIGTYRCSSDNGLLSTNNSSLSSPVKIGVLRKRQMETFHSTLSCMKLLDDLESENTPLFADTVYDSSLSFLTQSTGQKTLEYSICRNCAPMTSADTTDITSIPVITTTIVNTDTEQHESKNAFTATINDIPNRKMTLASCYDVTAVRVRRLMLSRSASDSKLFVGIGPQPKFGLADIQSCDARYKDVDELNRVTADIAAENPDMIRFQQVLNSWIGVHTGARTAAFLLISKECNSCFCQVCGNQLLKEPVYCGSADVLWSLFNGNALLLNKKELSPPPYTPHAPNIYVDIDMLSKEFREKIYAVLQKSGIGKSLPRNSISGTIFLLQARSNFVAGLLLLHQNESTMESERSIIMPHLHLIAALLSIVANIEEQKRLAQQSEVFLTMTQNVFSSLQDMNLLVRNITKEAKTLVHAEICSLFLLDRENSELVAEVFEKNGSNDEYLTEIRMPISLGIVGQVASTGQMMNVKEAYSHPAFYPKVDERTGFITRNILCFPIKDSSGNLVGVAELCNKIGKPAFTKHDEQIAMMFAVYCAISISHCLLYRKLQEAHRRSHLAAELLVQSSTLSIAPEDLLRLTAGDIPAATSFAPEFNHFNFSPRSIGSGDTYVEAALSIFKDLGFVRRFRLQRQTLACFLLMVQKGYRDVPYHNWSHAFAVAHFIYLLLRTETARDALNELESFALFVASLCHDIDHRGTTNAFQVQSRTPLAQLYSSEGSVLERHHFAQTISILNMEECNIFVSLNRHQFHSVLDHIRDIILATDIANHLQKVQDINRMVEVGFDSSIKHHRYLLICLMMTSADLSDQTKDFRNSKAIAENIYKEFFSQGDLEKQMGNRPLEMMDRDRACVPKLQLEFMDTIAIPVFEYLSQLLPESKTTYESMLFNRKCWSALDEILAEENEHNSDVNNNGNSYVFKKFQIYATTGYI
ncbi:cGMP-dependent 3',5'-cyclic phosphodiesterase [Dirofilaria immitis]